MRAFRWNSREYGAPSAAWPALSRCGRQLGRHFGWGEGDAAQAAPAPLGRGHGGAPRHRRGPGTCPARGPPGNQLSNYIERGGASRRRAEPHGRIQRRPAWVGAFPTACSAHPAPRSARVGRTPPGQEFPGCCLDKPTSRYLTSRRRFSGICRFPLGFLSHVSRRERVPPSSDAECSRCSAGGVLSSSIFFCAVCSRMRRARASSRCIPSRIEARDLGRVARRTGCSLMCGEGAMAMAMNRTVAPKVRTDVA